jgi:hypothetical protein
MSVKISLCYNGGTCLSRYHCVTMEGHVCQDIIVLQWRDMSVKISFLDRLVPPL